MNDPCTQEAPAIAEARHIPFLEWLGAHRERVADGEAVVAVDLVPELLEGESESAEDSGTSEVRAADVSSLLRSTG